MCMLIVNKKGKAIPETRLAMFEEQNPDGNGITWLDTGETLHDVEYDILLDKANQGRPYVFHFRYSTAGAVSTDNIHPFECGTNKVLYSNGTISGLGNSTMSDTAVISDVIKGMTVKRRKLLLNSFGVRFVVVNTSTCSVAMYGPKMGAAKPANVKTKFGGYSRGLVAKWHDKDGVWYSKEFENEKRYHEQNAYVSAYWDNYGLYSKRDTVHNTNPKINAITLKRRVVAVYGTLKKGYGNHSLLKNAKFLGEAKTSKKYWLDASLGIPYMYMKGANSKAKQVSVELYEVSASELSSCDHLEGVPYHYERYITSCKLDKTGGLISAYIYGVNQYYGGTTYSEYTGGLRQSAMHKTAK